MMPSVCLDANICIWGIKGCSSSGQETNVVKARYLLELLDKRQTRIVIPAVVVAELLEGTKSSEHIGFVTRLNQLFDVRPFDYMAALDYSRLVGKLDGNRDKAKVDKMLVATALASKCEAIYSEDPHVVAIATPIIEVRPLPTPPAQQLALPIGQ